MRVSSSLINKCMTKRNIVLALLFNAFLIPLCFTSSSSYADTHEIEGFKWALPIPVQSGVSTTPLTGNFYIDFPYDSVPDFNEHVNPVLGFHSRFDTNLQACEFTYTFPTEIGQNNSYTAGFNYVHDYNLLHNCLAGNGFTDITPLHGASVPDEPFYLRQLGNYWFASDGFYSKVHYQIDGVDTGRGVLPFYSIFTQDNPKSHPFSTLSLPLYNSISDGDCLGVSEGDTLTFQSQFVLDSDADYSNSAFDDSNSFIGYRVDYYTCDSNSCSTASEFVPVTPSFRFVTLPATGESVGYLDITGDVSISSLIQSYPYVSISLFIKARDSQDNYTWWIKSSRFDVGSFIIRDGLGDSTGCPIGGDLHGEFIYGNRNPSDSDDSGFLHGLTHLFNFNFINPFNAVFNLFTDQSSCADIPIISSMLHFEEGRVCPWFPPEVRNVTTPVLGLFSMVLLVGFLYKWLGSSSGNYVDDSNNVNFTSNNTTRLVVRYKKGGSK